MIKDCFKDGCNKWIITSSLVKRFKDVHNHKGCPWTQVIGQLTLANRYLKIIDLNAYHEGEIEV